MSFKELKIHSFGKVTSWPQLISEFLIAHACLQYVASDWPRTVLHPRCICLACIHTYSSVSDMLMSYTSYMYNDCIG